MQTNVHVLMRAATSAAGRIGGRLRKIPVLPPVEAYKLWAPTYDERSDNAILQLEEQIVLPILDDMKMAGRSVIDFGCGTGRHVRHALECGAEHIVGVDISTEMLSVARSSTGTSKVSYIQADLRDVPLRNVRFDCGIASLTLSHERDLEGAFREFHRLLRRNAELIISDLHWTFDSRGWKRTFKTAEPRSRLLAVRNVTHKADEYLRVMSKTGFEIEQFLQPVVNSSLLPIFRRTNMLSTYRRYLGEPLLVVFRLLRR